MRYATSPTTSAAAASSRQWLFDESLAALIHEHVCGSSIEITVPPASTPAPTGPSASTIAAFVTGASWGVSPAAQAQQFQRFRTKSFRVELNIGF